MSPPRPYPEAAGGRFGWAPWLRLFGWALSLICLLFLVRRVPVADTLSALAGGDPLLLACAALATVGNLALRGVRWMALLGRRTFRDLRLATAISVVGLALNATVPGKVGEIVRVGMAARRLRVRLGEAAMASLIERIIDLAVLSGLGFLTLAPARRWGGGADGDFSPEALAGLAAALLATSVGATLFVLAASYDRLGRPVRRAAASRFENRRWRRRVVRFLLDVRNGARRIRSRRAALPALASTLGLWVLLAVGVYLVGLAMPGVECSPPAAVAFAVVTTLASALPSAPGAWGVYEAAGVVVGSALVAADSPSALAAFVIASHAVQYLSVMGMGLACWIAMGRRSAGALEHPDVGGVSPDRELEP